MLFFVLIMVWFNNGNVATTVVQTPAPSLAICQHNTAQLEAEMLNDKNNEVDDVQMVCVSANKRPRI